MKTRGFTLVELMVAVAIVAILTAIAMPSYREHVAKSRRAEAMTALMDGAQALERYYSANSTYATARGSAALAGIYSANVPASGAAFYTLAASGTVGDNAYTLQATRTGSMANDRCGDFQIDQAGRHTLVNYSGFANAQAALDYCWRR